MNRLMLTPGLRRLWRGGTAIQFGVRPDRAVVVRLADAAHGKLLDLIDGVRTEHAVLRDAAAAGIPTGTASELLATLRRHALVVPAGAIRVTGMSEPVRQRTRAEAAALAIGHRPERLGDTVPDAPPAAEALRRRAAATVTVTGITRLVVPVATALAAAGVGHVDAQLKGRVTADDVVVAGLAPDDVGRPRSTRATTTIMRYAAEADTRPVRSGTASFLVQAGPRTPPELLAHGLHRRRLPHLLIEEQDDAILVGPLVIPGRTPCLHCQSLHRTDRDPAWPALAAQIATGPEMPAGTATSTVLIATGVAVAEVLAHLDRTDPARRPAGDPDAGEPVLAQSVEITPPARIRRRSWGPHPACACTRSAGPNRARAARMQRRAPE